MAFNLTEYLSKSWKLPGILVVLSGVLVAFASGSNEIGIISQVFYRYLHLLAIITLISAGVLGVSINLYHYITYIYAKNIGSYHYRNIKRNEIHHVLDLAKSMLPEIPSASFVKSLINVNKGIFYVQEVRKGVNGIIRKEIKGFFSLVPLTEVGAKLVDNEEIHGLKFTTEHIASPKMDTYAIYFGSIGASSKYAQGRVLDHVQGILIEKINNGIRVIYTRPITIEGLQLAIRYGFAPVDQKIDSEKGLNRVFRIEAKEFLSN